MGIPLSFSKKTVKLITIFTICLSIFFALKISLVKGAVPGTELQKYVLELPRITHTAENQDIVDKIRLQVSEISSANNHELIGARLWGTSNQLLWGHGKAVASIAQTIPYLDVSQTTQIKAFLDAEVTQYLLNQNHISTKEVSGSLGKDGSDTSNGISWTGNSAFCWEALYGLWAYGYYTNNWTVLQSNWSTIKSIHASCNQNSLRVIQNDGPTTQTLSGINSEIAGNIGMARMAKQFNDTTLHNTTLNRSTTLLSQKIDQVAAASNNPVVLKASGSLGRFLSIDLYQDLTPETARVLKDYQKSKVTTQMSTVTNRFRTWYLSDLDHVSDWMSVAPFPPVDDAGSRPGEEGYQMSLFATPIYLSRAYVSEVPVATLRKELPLTISSRQNPYYLDMFRLQHLVALMHRANGVSWSQ